MNEVFVLVDSTHGGDVFLGCFSSLEEAYEEGSSLDQHQRCIGVIIAGLGGSYSDVIWLEDIF